MRFLIVLTVAVLAFGSAPNAFSQGRDASDRGLRLENDELRSDYYQQRLKPSSPGLLTPQPQQNEPHANSVRKPTRTDQQKDK